MKNQNWGHCYKSQDFDPSEPRKLLVSNSTIESFVFLSTPHNTYTHTVNNGSPILIMKISMSSETLLFLQMSNAFDKAHGTVLSARVSIQLVRKKCIVQTRQTFIIYSSHICFAFFLSPICNSKYI